MALSFLRRIIFGDLLQPDDTFRMKVRKACVAISFVCSFPGLVTCIIASRNTNSSSVAMVINNAASCAVIFDFMGCWAVCRYTKRAGDSLLNVLLGIFVTATIVLILSSKSFPYQPVFLACAVCAVVFETNLKKLQLFLSLVG